MKKILAAIASIAAAGAILTTAAAGPASAATATTGVGIQLLDGSAPNPSYMQASIPQGGSKTWHVKITNTGSATETIAGLPTSALLVYSGGLASQPKSTLQSWITQSQTTAVVAAGQSTTIAVTVTVPATAPLGAVTGSAPGTSSALAVNTFWGYAYPSGGQVQLAAAAGVRMYITVTAAS
jgi:hypothetical protein